MYHQTYESCEETTKCIASLLKSAKYCLNLSGSSLLQGVSEKNNLFLSSANIRHKKKLSNYSEGKIQFRHGKNMHFPPLIPWWDVATGSHVNISIFPLLQFRWASVRIKIKLSGEKYPFQLVKFSFLCDIAFTWVKLTIPLGNIKNVEGPH